MYTDYVNQIKRRCLFFVSTSLPVDLLGRRDSTENQGSEDVSQDVAFQEIFFPVSQKMAYDREAPRKLPKSQDDLQTVEDQLSQIQAYFRKIRTGMRENGLGAVQLKMGTAEHHIRELSKIAAKMVGEYDSQLVLFQIEQTRERKRAELAEKEKKKNPPPKKG